MFSLTTFNAQLFSSGYNWLCNKKSGDGNAEKNCLTEGFIQIYFSSLASDLYILLLVHGSKEIRTWLTSLGKVDFLGKEAQDDQNAFPEKGKSETEAGENEQALSAHYSNSALKSGMGPEIPKSLVSLLLENGIGDC